MEKIPQVKMFHKVLQQPAEEICNINEMFDLVYMDLPYGNVLDPFCGSGTTVIASKMLGRNCITTDINPDAIALAEAGINDNVSLIDFLN